MQNHISQPTQTPENQNQVSPLPNGFMDMVKAHTSKTTEIRGMWENEQKPAIMLHALEMAGLIDEQATASYAISMLLDPYTGKPIGPDAEVFIEPLQNKLDDIQASLAEGAAETENFIEVCDLMLDVIDTHGAGGLENIKAEILEQKNILSEATMVLAKLQESQDQLFLSPAVDPDLVSPPRDNTFHIEPQGTYKRL